MNLKIVNLPSFLKPLLNNNLIRLGSFNDGGYLVCKDDIYDSDLLLSFGINDDWNFEKNLLEIKNLNCYAFDGSLSNKFWIKKFLVSLSRLKLYNLKKYIEFKKFFKNKNVFIKKYVSNLQNDNHITLSNILDNFCSGYNKIFLKIDIEGSEYRILDELIKNSHRFSSLVIEFHDTDLNFHKIEKFINSFSLKVIHVHANNYAETNFALNPTAIEVTFSNNYIKELIQNLPNNLDNPNDKFNSDYKIEFSN